MIKTLKAVSVLLALFCVAGGAFAGGDAKLGAGKSELCQGCHGVDGMSVNPECPNLAGQKPGYIFKQVKDFQHGKRNNDTMSAMAGLAGSDQDLKDISAYYASQKTMQGSRYMMGAPTDKKKIKAGKKIYLNGDPRTGLYGCVNCHGKNGKGKSETNQIFPVIGGQTKDYLVKQLKDFRKADRTNDPANMMMDIAKKLTDEQIDQLGEYLGSRE
ncbi:MAG: cytochrome c4 [Gammaproteobacteria bacterium]|nr:cytochrome c4 [Gammaproteobacteria bacterium]